MGCLKLHILDEQYKSTEIKESNRSRKLTSNFLKKSAYNGRYNWITDANGELYQHISYLPFGEEWVDIQPYSWSAPYRFSGKEKDSESDYNYFGDRYYNSELSIWLSVDRKSDQYPSTSPYAYCGNRPTVLIDPNGMEWEDLDGNKVTDHSKIKVYIFYDPRGDGQGFGNQSASLAKQYRQIYGEGSVAMSNVTTMSEFSQDWGNMASPDIREVNLNYHGSNQALHLNTGTGQYITSTGDGTTNKSNTEGMKNVQDLPTPAGNISNAQLNVNSCRSMSTTQRPLKGKEQLTLGAAFAKYFDFANVRGTDRGVSYTMIGFPRTQPGSDWINISRRPTNILRPLPHPMPNIPRSGSGIY